MSQSLCGCPGLFGGTWARTGLPPALASATYDAANQQLTFDNQALTYDVDGSLKSDAANTYSWNPRNQLVAINEGISRPRISLDTSVGSMMPYLALEALGMNP